MKKYILLIIILSLGCLDQSEDMSILPREESLEVFEGNIAGDISVDVKIYNGYIEIYMWDKPSYRIEAVKWARAPTSEEAKEMAEDITVDFSEEREEDITLVLKTEETITAGVDVTVYLPRTTFTTVDVSTLNGHIKMEEMHATDVFLVTANGDITADVTADTLKVKTTNGKIRGFYHGSQTIIETGNGRIDVKLGTTGEYDMKTTNGDIDITVASDFTFNVRTTVGDITVEADNVVYTLEDKDHKKGYTAADAPVVIIASTTTSSITVEKE
jgi:DUF4097 and DUF4098 domain-containing protein YvlB